MSENSFSLEESKIVIWERVKKLCQSYHTDNSLIHVCLRFYHTYILVSKRQDMSLAMYNKFNKGRQNKQINTAYDSAKSCCKYTAHKNLRVSSVNTKNLPIINPLPHNPDFNDPEKEAFRKHFEKREKKMQM